MVLVDGQGLPLGVRLESSALHLPRLLLYRVLLDYSEALFMKYALVLCGIPLLFVFSYPRYLFSENSLPQIRKYAVRLHIAGITTATILFAIWADFRDNHF